MSQKVLVFNHSENLLMLYASLLRAKGYEAFTYQQDMHSFNEVEEVQPDLIILGNIQYIDDEECKLLHNLKRDARYRHIPVVVASTNADQLRQDDDFSGLDKVVVINKPFDAKVLLSVVSRFFN
jgi:CheY-like chemotaxis protein